MQALINEEMFKDATDCFRGVAAALVPGGDGEPDLCLSPVVVQFDADVADQRVLRGDLDGVLKPTGLERIASGELAHQRG